LYQFQCYHCPKWNFKKQNFNGLLLNGWICAHKKIKNTLKSPCYQMDNLTNATSLFWFTFKCKRWVKTQ
jgi:hypothetical protein